MSNRVKAYISLIMVAAIWGAAGPIIKYTLEGIDPLPFMSYRLLIASTFSMLFFAIKLKKGKKFNRLRAHLPFAVLYGLLSVPMALGFLFLALDRTTVLDLTLVNVITPLIVTLGGTIFYKEHITKREKLGIMIVIAGVILNSLYPVLKDGENLVLTGNIFLLLYLISDCAAILIAKKEVRYKIKSGNLTNLSFIVGALVIIPITIWLYGASNIIDQITTLPLKYHLGVWYMALISGNLAYYLFVRGQKSIEVSEATLFGYLQPLFMIPLAIFWLGEIPRTSFIAGAIIIAVGLFIAEVKKRRYNIR